MAYSTTTEFKTVDEQHTHDLFVKYLRRYKGQTFRGWLIAEEREQVRLFYGTTDPEPGEETP